MGKNEVTVLNEDGSIRAIHCKIQQKFSIEPNGKVTHVAIFWRDDYKDPDGTIYIVPIEHILYEIDD